ncbi:MULTISPECIES: hypothetical protein [Pediococcus]|nr:MULTISPECIES: hypothetical protein [Pediococcus]
MKRQNPRKEVSMTQTKNSTTSRYQQLKPEERGIIQALLTQKLSLR